jgi:hypothetical protein
METLKARRAWSEVFLAQNENNFNHRKLDHQANTTKISSRNTAHRK